MRFSRRCGSTRHPSKHPVGQKQKGTFKGIIPAVND
jgi:hypothetical protein